MPSPTWAQLAQANPGMLHIAIDPRPTTPAPTGQVNRASRGGLTFRSWEEALRFIYGVPDTMLGFLEIVADVEVPPGSWDVRGMTIRAGAPFPAPFGISGQPVLTIPADATIDNVAGFADLNVVIEDGAGPVLTYADAEPTQRSCVIERCTVRLGEGATFAQISGETVFYLWHWSTVVTRVQPATAGERLLLEVTAATAVAFVVVQGTMSVVDNDVLRCVGAGDLTVIASTDALVGQQPRVLVSTETLIDREAPAPWTQAAVLVAAQLTTAGGQLQIRQATGWGYVSGANFAPGDTFSITDGTTTETWTATAGAPGANEFQIQATPSESNQALCAAIESDGVLWGAAEPVGGLDLGFGSICILYRRDQDAPAYLDRVFATTTPVLGVLDFNRAMAYESYSVPGDVDYPTVVTPIPTVDPEVPYFGWGTPNAPAGTLIALLDEVPGGWVYRGTRALGAGTAAWATVEGYTPADPIAWNSHPPATVTEALDRIAGALGPIT